MPTCTWGKDSTENSSYRSCPGIICAVFAGGPSAVAAEGDVQLADRDGSGELRSINVHRQGSDLSSEQTPLSRYTPSALLLPDGGHSSQRNSPMHAVAEGAHATALVSTSYISPTANPHGRSSIVLTSVKRVTPVPGRVFMPGEVHVRCLPCP